MTTRFDGRRRSRHDDLPLAGLPAWGLEMMMGLYGPETIRRACAEESELGVEASPGALVAGHAPPAAVPITARPGAGPDGREDTPAVFNQVDAELEAINSLVRYLGRKLRRR
ncbi:hypothetical protein [Gordonia sp. NPDC058843]|uniref:hypothetical protein n=1 Tax=Gordonia sp. NPDC058843 TaxID=3346648 RepID=UPI00368E7166